MKQLKVVGMVVLGIAALAFTIWANYIQADIFWERVFK